MPAFIARIKAEPAIIIGLVQALAALGIAFGLALTTEQVGAILAVTAAVLSLVTRQLVTPAAKPAKPPAPVLLALLAVFASLTLGGCARQQGQRACRPALEGSAVVAMEVCTQAYRRAATREELGTIDLVCLPLAEAAQQIEQPATMRALCGGA